MKLRCALLGETLGHSYSKQIHSYFGDYSYDLLSVSRDKFTEIVRSGEYDGLNVTIPYKELAFSLCDEVCEIAGETGCVNTVVYRDGKILGYNTDVAGFIGMVKAADIDFSGKNVLILGSGGTSKTARLAAKKMGAARISVVSRSGEINYDNVYELSDTEIIVNTTPVGMYPKNGISPIDLSRFEKLCGAVDVIYNPQKTKFLMDASSLGVKTCGGIYMLSAQAFRAAEIFLGLSLPEKLIDDAVRGVLKTTENIVLIGMPGSGKSTIGKLVAKALNRDFADTDEIITAQFASPEEIINTRGVEEFRRIECEVVREVSKKSGFVISTGGGVVEREENYESLSGNGKIFLISRALSALATDGRPLSKDVFALFDKRREKYICFADFIVENDTSPEECAQKIAALFK